MKNKISKKTLCLLIAIVLAITATIITIVIFASRNSNKIENPNVQDTSQSISESKNEIRKEFFNVQSFEDYKKLFPDYEIIENEDGTQDIRCKTQYDGKDGYMDYDEKNNTMSFILDFPEHYFSYDNIGDTVKYTVDNEESFNNDLDNSLSLIDEIIKKSKDNSENVTTQVTVVTCDKVDDKMNFSSSDIEMDKLKDTVVKMINGSEVFPRTDSIIVNVNSPLENYTIMIASNKMFDYDIKVLFQSCQ